MPRKRHARDLQSVENWQQAKGLSETLLQCSSLELAHLRRRFPARPRRLSDVQPPPCSQIVTHSASLGKKRYGWPRAGACRGAGYAGRHSATRRSGQSRPGRRWLPGAALDLGPAQSQSLARAPAGQGRGTGRLLQPAAKQNCVACPTGYPRGPCPHPAEADI